nr:Chain c, 60S ribosomal protein L30 [Saccharomyces cerevisiae BY4741]
LGYIIIAANTPVLRKSVYYFQGGNNELGTAVGKLFRVGVVS